MHRILFICGCLENGYDGVGDYTRALVQELANMGMQCCMVSINDHYQEVIKEENIIRISSKSSIREKRDCINQIIQDFKPTLISLQFVPYSFHSKGIIRSYLPIFKEISKIIAFHIMFHELWVDIDPNPTIKTRIVGYLQKRYIKALVKKTKPLLITTSNPYYERLLKKNNIETKKLPLLSNIPLQRNLDYRDVELIFECSLEDKKNMVIACFFGSIYDGWNYIEYIENLLLKIKTINKRLMIISIGNMGKSGIWEKMVEYFSGRIQFRTSGQVNPKIVSTLLSCSDIGISTTPAHLIAKSGSFVAMVQHGLSVMLTRKFENLNNGGKIPYGGIDTTDCKFDINLKNLKIDKLENYNKEICNQFSLMLNEALATSNTILNKDSLI